MRKSVAKSARAKEPKDPYKLEHQVGFLLRRAHQFASSVFQDEMSELALTPPQFAAMVQVRDHGIVSQNKLGRMIDTDPATMQGIVKRLADRGLVVRLTDKNHKRKVNLQLSDDGQRLLEQATVRAANVTATTLNTLDAKEKHQLIQLLTKLVKTPG